MPWIFWADATLCDSINQLENINWHNDRAPLPRWPKIFKSDNNKSFQWHFIFIRSMTSLIVDVNLLNIHSSEFNSIEIIPPISEWHFTTPMAVCFAQWLDKTWQWFALHSILYYHSNYNNIYLHNIKSLTSCFLYRSDSADVIIDKIIMLIY